MVILGISAVILLIVAIMCGNTATSLADTSADTAPAREFAIRQLTAAAWVCLGGFVALISVVGVHQMWIEPYMPAPEVQDGEAEEADLEVQ